MKLLLLASLASALLAPATPTSCIATTAAQKRAAAHVIFDGVAPSSATRTGIQRFRVTRYLKGRGATNVRVRTGNSTRVTTSISIDPRRGQRWRIFARRTSTPGLLRTDACMGSRKL